MHCSKCGRDEVQQDPVNKHMCVDCSRAENNRITYYRQHQDDWLAVAKESGLDPWEQQPGETQWEFTIWTAYRDSYPGKRPSYGTTAAQLNTTYNVVKHVAQRWSFPVRMQAWMRNVDQLTLAQRKEEILDMNATHIKLAKALNAKIEKAIEMINPSEVKPGEISSLFKTAAELERKARMDSEAQDVMRRDMFANPELKKDTKQATPGDLSEVVSILAKAGVLEGMTVKQTTTTEISTDQAAIDVEAREVEDDT